MNNENNKENIEQTTNKSWWENIVLKPNLQLQYKQSNIGHFMLLLLLYGLKKDR